MSTTLTSDKMLMVALLTAAATFAVPASASNSYAMPQPIREGNITYVTGGIGEGEQSALRAEAGAYDLRVTNANAKGQYTVGTNFTIMSKDGRELGRVSDTGPLFFAKLAPGDYQVKASNDGQERVREVKISSKRPTNIHLIWHES